MSQPIRPERRAMQVVRGATADGAPSGSGASVGPGDAPYGRANCDGPYGCGREGLRLTKAELLPRHKVPDRSGWCVDSGRWPAESSSGTGAIAHIHP